MIDATTTVTLSVPPPSFGGSGEGLTEVNVAGTVGGTTYSFRHSDSVWVSRIGLNYSWGGSAPVVARY